MAGVSEISVYDFPNTITVPDGYDDKTVPSPTWENMEFLMEKYNEVVKYIHHQECEGKL